MSEKIYVVTMYRWGSKEKHSYVLGVYDNKEKAIDSGEEERQHRGGSKYYPECLELNINDTKKNKIVVELVRNPHLA